MKEQTIEQLYPLIPWRVPVKVVRTDGIERWGCRICIGTYGLEGRNIHHLWKTPNEVERHMREFHP